MQEDFPNSIKLVYLSFIKEMLHIKHSVATQNSLERVCNHSNLNSVWETCSLAREECQTIYY